MDFLKYEKDGYLYAVPIRLILQIKYKSVNLQGRDASELEIKGNDGNPIYNPRGEAATALWRAISNHAIST